MYQYSDFVDSICGVRVYGVIANVDEEGKTIESSWAVEVLAGIVSFRSSLPSIFYSN